MKPPIHLAADGRVARLTLDRAEKRNAIDQAMWEAIPRLVGQALADPAVRIITVESAASGIFCAGADIGEFASRARDPAWRRANQAAIRAAQLAIARAPVPTLAIIDGDCVGGGCGLAIACDLRIASPRARLGITPARLGLVYSLHDTRLLVDLVGPAKARRMLYTGQLLAAADAWRLGLVDEVGEAPGDAARQLEEAILACAPSSQRASKAIIRRILDGATDDDDDSAALVDRAFESADFAEGVAAFLERRAPRFPG